jgi:hypothetical protein
MKTRKLTVIAQDPSVENPADTMVREDGKKLLGSEGF